MDSYLHKEITGKKFNELMKGKQLCKVLNEQMNHWGFQYNMGLNADTNKFEADHKSIGGLYFTTKQIGIRGT